MRFTIRSVEVSFSFWFFAVVALFSALDAKAFSFYFVLPVVLHELGHLFVMTLCRVDVKSIRFTPFSIDIQKKSTYVLAYGKEIAISLGGIAFNLFAAVLLHIFTFASMRTQLLIAANLAVAFFNLLPIGNLDGGTVCRLLAERFFSLRTAGIVSNVFSVFALAPLFGLGIFLVLQPERNFSLLVVCVYLLLNVLIGS